MQQLQIDYFWPLTEQIPLDLDYTGCERPKLTTNIIGDGSIGYTLNSGWSTGAISVVASNLSLDVDTTTVKMKEKPNLCRRTLYKCLGLKWELK